jgi:chromosome segregation ATPase
MTDPTTELIERANEERDRLRAEVTRLTACLAKANTNHEDFERRWYLACDENDRLTKERDEVRKAIASERDDLRRFLDAEKAQVDGMGKRNTEAMRILGVTPNNREGVVEGAQRVVAERDRLAVRVTELETLLRDALNPREKG